ncbi:MAG: hypothetical protein NZ524_04855 [Thiobacillaceae bacterium]|nr:hypothetical protein [Thiobacillaceae bacterium]
MAEGMHQVVLLQAGLIEHLTCYVFTGRACSIRRAARLAAELAGCAQLPLDARGHWQGLAEALEDMLPASPPREAPAASDASAGGKLAPTPQADVQSAAARSGAVSKRQPWLTWEQLTEAA